MYSLTCLILLPIPVAVSQTAEPPSAFISANAGGFMSAKKDFDKAYHSPLGFAFGGAFGLPVSAQTFLYGKVTYFSKTGVPLIYTLSLQNGILAGTTTPGSGTAIFRQWIMNFGGLENVNLTKELSLGINGGLTYSMFSEEYRPSGSSPGSTSTGRGLLGIFAGVDLEDRFADSPISVFAEAQYDYAWPFISFVIGDYGGLNLTAGIRYYFKDSRRR
jgi:hypothetical protein